MPWSNQLAMTLVNNCMCKPKREAMICLAGRNNILYGSRSWKSAWQGGQSAHYHLLTTTNTSQNITFYTLYAFKNLKSSSTWFNPCFPLRRAYLLLYVESVYLLISILEGNTCVNFVHHFLYACLLHLLYCFVLTIIPEIYMLKVESSCWNLNLPMCCLNALLWIYCFMS